MAPKPKNKDKEQQKEKKKLYDRLRREKMKKDPEKALEMKLKEQEKYRRKKEKKQVKLVADMSEREKRAERKKWRERSLAYLKRKREKQQQSMPLAVLSASSSCCGATSTPPSSQKKAGLKRKRRAQTQTARVNQRLREENLRLRRKNEAVRKKLKRMQTVEEKSADPTSPRKVVRNLMKSKDKSIIRKQLLKGEVLARQLHDSFKRVKSKKAKRFIANVMSQENGLLRKYGLLTKFNFLSSRILANRKKHSSSNNQRDRILRKITQEIKSHVEKFFELDENSRCLAGKKDCITLKKVKKQKRILLADLNVLYEKFLRDHTYKISYTSFCRLRPFWIVKLDVSKRETCQCQKCDNFELMLKALHHHQVLESPAFQRYIEQCCCIPHTSNCLHRTCDICKEKKVSFSSFDKTQIVTFEQWTTTKVKYKYHKTKSPRETSRLVKKSLQISLNDLVGEVKKKTRAFFEHHGNILRQYSAIKQLKMTLGKGEVLIHCDFSENYSTKYASEVQAIHFGGNRSQISLHTVVVYFRTDKFSPETHTSFFTVSENLDHGPAAVWAHLQPIFRYINRNFHPVSSVHFLTDGPSSQYKNKSMFYFFQHKLKEEFSELKVATWNFHEAGHGKGAVDGIGATVKRTADRAVAQGKDICNVDTFVNVLSDKIRASKLFVVDSELIENMTRSLIPIKLTPFKGTMQVHQVAWIKGAADLHMNKLSCFSCSRDCKKYMIGTHSSLRPNGNDEIHLKRSTVEATSQKPGKRPLENVTTHVLNAAPKKVMLNNEAPNMTNDVPTYDCNRNVSVMTLSNDDENNLIPEIDFSEQEKPISTSGLCRLKRSFVEATSQKPGKRPLENVTTHVLNVAPKKVMLNDEVPNMTNYVPSYDCNRNVSVMTLSNDDENNLTPEIDFSDQEKPIFTSGLCHKCGGAISSKRPGISCDICEEIFYHKQCAAVDDNVGLFCCTKCDILSQDLVPSIPEF